MLTLIYTISITVFSADEWNDQNGNEDTDQLPIQETSSDPHLDILKQILQEASQMVESQEMHWLHGKTPNNMKLYRYLQTHPDKEVVQQV